MLFKNSTELLDCALRELQVAIKEEKKEVEIKLSDAFPDELDKIQRLVEKLEIKVITELLREEFKDYTIKSVVTTKNNFSLVLTFQKGPCAFSYPLVWKLSLQKK